MKHGSGRKPVNPAQYAVDPASYPAYRVAEGRFPPKLEMFFDGKRVRYPFPYGSIEPGDTWRVRYRFRDFLVINSREFDARQCNFRASPCLRDGRPFWCIYISGNGEVTGGWDNCPCVSCDSHRFAPDPEVVGLQKWEPWPYFIPDR